MPQAKHHSAAKKAVILKKLQRGDSVSQIVNSTPETNATLVKRVRAAWQKEKAAESNGEG